MVFGRISFQLKSFDQLLLCQRQCGKVSIVIPHIPSFPCSSAGLMTTLSMDFGQKRHYSSGQGYYWPQVASSISSLLQWPGRLGTTAGAAPGGRNLPDARQTGMRSKGESLLGYTILISESVCSYFELARPN